MLSADRLHFKSLGSTLQYYIVTLFLSNVGMYKIKMIFKKYYFFKKIKAAPVKNNSCVKISSMHKVIVSKICSSSGFLRFYTIAEQLSMTASEKRCARSVLRN